VADRPAVGKADTARDPTPRRRRLRFVLCADDFAMSASVSAGILDLLARGRVSATGAMTNCPAWATAAAPLKAFAGKADLGVHLNLTWGVPLGPLPRLAPGGALPALGTILRAALLGRLPLAEIAEEFKRQIDAFVGPMGREPDFLDGHQHVHALPGVRDALFTVLGGLGLTGRVYLRDPADRAGAILARRLSAGKAASVAMLARGFAKTARRRGFATNEGFAGFSSFDPRRDLAADFERFLLRPGRRPLVMCHPGLGRDEEGDDASRTRPLEQRFLAGEAFAALLRRLDAAPARFADLSGGA
jgi:predicted glycoside hydrolase/deacetylase ChbG (UPF0249 family)